MKISLLLSIVVLNIAITTAQTGNINFENGNFDGWQLDVGVRIDEFTEDYTINAPRDFQEQFLILDPSVPPINEFGTLCTVPDFPTVFPGGNFSARIGNLDEGGRKAARVSRSFIVQPNTTYLQYSYAIILEDPDHDRAEQPKFVVNIKDTSGTIVTCGKFEAFAGTDAASQGFVGCDEVGQNSLCDFPITDCPGNAFFGAELQILPWTTGGADLTPYIGQEITIEFISLDCDRGAHGALAYLDASIEPLEILVNNFCAAGDDITLEAPLGFVSYLWSTGETTRTINVQNTQFGDVYTVDLISNTGCDTQVSITLEPKAAATIDAIADQTICSGASVVVVPTGTNAGSFEFTWPTDNSVKGLSVSLSPTMTTTYTVYALDENGCRGGATTFTINVLTGGGSSFPEAAFDYTQITGTAPNLCNTLQFNNTSSYCKNDLTYLWDFGDGTTSTDENPQHTFPTDNNQQSYTITLTVTSASDMLMDTTTATFESNGVAPSFTIADTCGAVTITNTTMICDGLFDTYTGFTYTWDFGDGGPVQTTDETQPTVNYSYTTSGNYTIALVVTDTNTTPNNKYDVDESLEVNVGITVDFSFETACFEVDFQSSIDTCAPITSYLWDFGDGNTSTEVEPTHTYGSLGPFTVALTVSDGTLSVTSTPQTVTLNPPPTVANFTFARNCDEVVFTNTSAACNPLTYAWDFGDGTSSTEINPTHIFPYGQTYSVTLTINDGIQDYPIVMPVEVEKLAVYVTPPDMEVCGVVGALSATFDLTTQSAIILQNVPATVVTIPLVTYHLSATDAEMGENRINNAFENTTNPQTIYARVTEPRGCLVETYAFAVRVNETPDVNTIEDIFLCASQQATNSYDLTQLNGRMFMDLQQAEASLSYHESEDDAMSAINPITTIDLITGVGVAVYARAENPVAKGCYSISVFTIQLDDENTDPDNCSLTVANAMTPNGDGANDVFFIQNIETFPKNQLTIFNRWGNKVFETRGYTNDWDGTFNGKPLPVATYYYVLELNDAQKQIKSGYVSLLR